MMEKLEDNDDVQNVYSNFDIDEDVLATLPAVYAQAALDLLNA